MLATEYHLDRRVRSAHRGAEISTAGWQVGANMRNCDAADSGRLAGREGDEGAGSPATAANAGGQGDAALGPPPLAF
jgi:hypothetical protein